MTRYMQETRRIPKYMGITEASEFFGVSRYSIRTSIKNGELLFVKRGVKYMVDVEDLQNKLDKEARANRKELSW